MPARAASTAIVVLSLAGCLLPACTQLQIASAGEVGCSPKDVEISQRVRGWSTTAWQASCQGKIYQCSSVATANAVDYSCMPLADQPQPDADDFDEDPGIGEAAVSGAPSGDEGAPERSGGELDEGDSEDSDGQDDEDEPDADDADEPDADEPDADEPDAAEPDADEPDADEPDADEPDADAPENVAYNDAG